MSHPSPQVSPVTAPAQPAPDAPSTAHHAQGTATTADHTTTHASRVSTAATLAPAPASQTFFEKLNVGDEHWEWKIGMRIVLIIICLIGLGCAAWVTAKFTHQNTYYDYLYDTDDGWSIPWTLITFTLSIIWSVICVLLFLLRKTHSPMHPGAQVGVDLILWLGYIPTGLFAVLAVLSVKDFGSDGTIGSYSSSGAWNYVQGNNTWVYNSSAGYSYSSSSSSSSRSCKYSNFQTCEQLDLYINQLWSTKNSRFNSELCATVCQFMALFLHFVLFVWACVDTNRRKSRKVGKDAEKLAAEIIQTMIKSGAIIPAPGQAHMRPAAPMYPHMMQGYPPPQQYPQYPQYQQFPQQQPYPVSQQPQAQHFSRPLSSPHAPQQPIVGTPPAVPSSSNEKSQGTRFA